MPLSLLVTQCFGESDPLPLAREAASRWHDWLLPISEVSPAGEDPAYADDFQHVREEVDKLSGADPAQVAQRAGNLLETRCKDLRVATYYLWARLQLDGEPGLADGLNLVAALLERFPQDILPSRPASRRMALEWLATAKVLDGLARFPAVVKEEAERTVAALAWLDRSVQAWPQDQRPQLGGLYSALSERLARSGGVSAVVPQNTAVQAPPPVATAPDQAPRSGRELLDSGRLLAGWLREQENGWLAGHRLMRSLRWDTLSETPPHDTQARTHLYPPRDELVTLLKRLHVQQRWDDLLEEVEGAFAEGVNHFWLDLHWYLHQALARQTGPRRGWADIVQRDLGMFLERLPGLEALCWTDGSPLADERTREWIASSVAGNQRQNWLPVATSESPAGHDDILALEEEALAQADSEGVEQALAWLAGRPDVRTGRQRWLLRLLMARLAEQYGKGDLALHLLAELDAMAERQALACWEPDLLFEVKARLLKLLRVRAQRGDADRASLTRRMDAQLAVLVAIDPVRAAVLCG
ncbi:MAG: type VI secretion system protein TssA [Paucimonas sp.]|jgi:type VI secretion system protein VasJ|nr:type VI secretion system protein TssA [Paucimonas sp.]